jgi:hypothetical protein
MTNEMSHSVFHFYSHSGTHIDNKLYIYNLVSSQVVPTKLKFDLFLDFESLQTHTQSHSQTSQSTLFHTNHRIGAVVDVFKVHGFSN